MLWFLAPCFPFVPFSFWGGVGLGFGFLAPALLCFKLEVACNTLEVLTTVVTPDKSVLLLATYTSKKVGPRA